MLTDLAAGLGMVGPRMLGLDAEREELLFGHPGHVMVAFGGEDQPVVGEERSWVTPGLGRFVQHADDIVGLDHPHGQRGAAEPRVVMLSTS